MLKTFSIDGFKSLTDFNISFTTGLNVIVGPNGSGKTNICQALGFLQALTKNQVSDYISEIGGIKASLSNENEKAFIQTKKGKIKLSATGQLTTEEKKGTGKYELKYSYKGEIVLGDDITIQNESLFLSRKNKDSKRFTRILDASKKNGVIAVDIRDHKLIGPISIVKENAKTFKIEHPNVRQESIFEILSKIFFNVFAVKNEFTNIQAYNINPTLARVPSDLSDPKRIQSSGRFLSNALHKLIQANSSINEINTVLSQLVPNFVSVKSEISVHSLKRFFSFIDKENNEINSISISDGTIKLLALLVGIIEQKDNFTIIEEPENYLHPYASNLLVEYLRDKFENSTCILTSHSETILNLIKPNEILICELNAEGHTTCMRVENSALLSKIIEKTGFGCGYHYIAGNIGGTPNG